jgi:hypothetical protein
MLSDILLRDGPFQFSTDHRLALELEIFLRNLIENSDPVFRIDENDRFFPVPQQNFVKTLVDSIHSALTPYVPRVKKFKRKELGSQGWFSWRTLERNISPFNSIG